MEKKMEIVAVHWVSQYWDNAESSECVQRLKIQSSSLGFAV